MTKRGGIFSPSLHPPPSLLIPLCPNDANKIRIPLTHLVPVCRQRVSSRFLKGQSGYRWLSWWYSLTCGNIVVGSDCGTKRGGASLDGRSGAVRQPEVTLWSHTGLSKPGWDGRHSLNHYPRPESNLALKTSEESPEVRTLLSTSRTVRWGHLCGQK